MFFLVIPVQAVWHAHAQEPHAKLYGLKDKIATIKAIVFHLEDKFVCLLLCHVAVLKTWSVWWNDPSLLRFRHRNYLVRLGKYFWFLGSLLLTYVKCYEKENKRKHTMELQIYLDLNIVEIILGDLTTQIKKMCNKEQLFPDILIWKCHILWVWIALSHTEDSQEITLAQN